MNITGWHAASSAYHRAPLRVQARQEAIDKVVSMLDLTGVRGTVVGDKKTRGISGGEKKRLSIACELLSAPSLLFLDEPTTGLDAFQALKARP